MRSASRGSQREPEGGREEQERDAERGRGRGDLDDDGGRFRKALGVDADTVHHGRSVQERAKQPQRHGPAAQEDRSARPQNADETSSQRSRHEPAKQEPRLEQLPLPRLTGQQPDVEQREPTTGCNRCPADHPNIVVVFLSAATSLSYRVAASSSSIADDTASGFSLGMKCPTPGTTRRATSDVNDARSAGGDSVDGRAIPSSAPYRVIEGA